MGEASKDALERLATALDRHDAGLLRVSIEDQIDKGADEQLVRTLINLVESLPVTEAAKAAERAERRPSGPTTTIRRRGGKRKPIEIAPGYYTHPADGRTIKVARSQSSGYCYAMDLVNGKWKFISGLIKELDVSRTAPAPGTSDQVALNNLVREVAARRAASA